MAASKRTNNRLTPEAVADLGPGRYTDGNNLWLCVTERGTRQWLYCYMNNRKAHQLGLGGCRLDSLGPGRANMLKRAKDELGRARRAATELTGLRLQGIDPATQRREARAVRATRAAEDAKRAVSFRHAAERYIASHKAAWKNPKHRWQWSATIESHAYPVIGDLPVADVETSHITQILEPLWLEKTETASRLRGRLEVILDYARVSGWRSGENPARWRGHLDHVFAPKRKVAKVEHLAALPYADVPRFMRQLRAQTGTAALALRFTILTACRTGEVIGARWEEIDMDAKTWTVPASRMKAGKEHRVPLSDAALEVLRLAKANASSSPFIFPGQSTGRGLSNMGMLVLLRRMNRSDLTVHGFRSTFRDWVSETTNYPREVAEMALAHAVSNAVEAAYRRGDLFDKRRSLMQDWAEFVSGSDHAKGNAKATSAVARIG